MAISMLELLSQDSLFKVAEDKIEGGKADGRPDSDYPKDQLEKGMEVEKEHTDSEAEAKEITKDHLEEEKELDPDKDKDDLEYYDELGDMEDGLKKKAFDAGFFDGFEKAAGDDLVINTSPALLRTLIGGGVGAGVGGVVGREIGHGLSKVPPVPWSRSAQLLSEFSPANRRKVLEVIESLGKSRGAMAGAALLGSAGVYLGAKPSFE